jgi:uncharacterized protein
LITIYKKYNLAFKLIKIKLTEKEDILSFLKENKEFLFHEFGLIKIGLFGSFSRNEGTSKSDIDLIVEFEPNTIDLSEKKSKIKNFISQHFKMEVDLCREKYIKPYFRHQILQSVIYV